MACSKVYAFGSPDVTREICILLLRGLISAIESGTLGLPLGPLIEMLIYRALATAEILEVPKPLEVLI